MSARNRQRPLLEQDEVPVEQTCEMCGELFNADLFPTCPFCQQDDVLHWMKYGSEGRKPHDG